MSEKRAGGKNGEGVSCLISLNFSSASGDGFLSGWYCDKRRMRSEVMSWKAKTDLHGGLAVCLLEFCVVHICLDAELRGDSAKREFVIEGGMLETREWPKREDRRSPSRNILFPLVAWFVNGGYVDEG